MTLEAAVVAAKLVHVAGIAVWAGGLLAMPAVLLARDGLEGEPFERLQRQARFLHVALVSPAAFVAVAAGIALIFLRGVYVEWMSLKLLFVGVLSALHFLTGLAVLSAFQRDGRFRRRTAAALIAGDLGAILAILLLVLAKPEIDAGALAGELLTPGGLGAALGPLVERVSATTAP